MMNTLLICFSLSSCLIFQGCKKINVTEEDLIKEQPVLIRDPKTGRESLVSSEVISLTLEKDIVLSLKKDSNVDEEFGIELISVNKFSAKIRSVADGKRDDAKIGGFYTRSFGTCGLRLVDIDISTQTVRLKRMYSGSF